MYTEELDTERRTRARVVSTERITPATSAEEVRELVLELASDSLSPDVGQNVGVLAPGQSDFGQEHHLRLYSIADLPETTSGGHKRIKIAVKRCDYIDDYSGERYPGVASNYLCDLREGDELTLTGPYPSPFQVPAEPDANLILIATGTGIAPFRAFVRHLYERTDFAGRLWLFYGSKSGLDAIYLNDERDDFAQYYDRPTFQAFRALSPRPHFHDDIAWGETLRERGEELWELMMGARTYIYVAGREKTMEQLDAVLAEVAGSKQAWERRKAELSAGRRWVELVF